MLAAPCGGFGFGSSIGGCADCDWEHPLTTTALSFGVVPLNRYVRFRWPGTYTCSASSADVTTTPRDEKFRPALLVKSNPIVLTIVSDPAWAHSAAILYGKAYEMLCRGDDVPGHRFLVTSAPINHVVSLLPHTNISSYLPGFFAGLSPSSRRRYRRARRTLLFAAERLIPSSVAASSTV